MRAVGEDSPWRADRKTHWDTIAGIMRKGYPVNPILQAPWVTTRIFRIDWLHAVDLGVGADYLGNVFHLCKQSLPGASRAARVLCLWQKVQKFYKDNGVQDKLQNLTEPMIKAQGRPPKLRASAACTRALIPFGLQLARETFVHPSPEQAAALVGMEHLDFCYRSLSRDTIFAKDLFEDSAVKFASQYCALEAYNKYEQLWRVKPKLHLFLELALERGRPTTCWTYRDEDFGGSVAHMARRRGGLLSSAAFSINLLDRFRMQQPVIRMRS